MPNDLAVIRRIEKTIGKKLEKIKLNDIFGVINGFALDDGGRVKGVNLLNCKLSDISALQSLTELEVARLENNQLSDISALQSLTQLKVLDLENNQLSDISALQSLTLLKELWLNNNQLSDISALQWLLQLKMLDLANNKITRLPTFITQWNMEIEWDAGSTVFINLYNNPLENPPVEIVKQGREAIRNYFTELEKSSTFLLQAKLLLVGSGEVGKTTLMRTLTEPDFQLKEDYIGKEPTTHGIRIKPWSLTCPLEGDSQPSRDLTLHTWDFGGQDIYHSTHQFFLTKRSLYIFLWEARKDEDSHSFDYWLNVIKLLSDNSPVIVVMNKADVRGLPIDEAAYAGKFKNIAAFLQVSCLTRRGIDELNAKIREVLGCMPHLKDKLPASWQDIRHNLEKEQKNYIDAEFFYGICADFDLDRERADYLSDYLHDLGAILRFRTDPLLRNTLILNPQWATEAVYKLVDTREIMDNMGRFDFDDLETIWDRDKFPPAKHRELMRLMEKFELCFNFRDSSTYIVPELVPGQRSGCDIRAFEGAGCLRFRYRYDFMPKGIVSRFIARNYFLIEDDRFWQNGVVLCFEESRALVIGDPPGRCLTISVTGFQKRELLAIIRNDLNLIHASLNMKKEQKHFQEFVPCNCSACLNAEAPHLFPFDVLKKMAQFGKSLTCFNSYEDVSPALLSGGYEIPAPEGSLLQPLIVALSQLQGKGLKVHSDENSRNGVVALLLNARGFRVQEQILWGRSPSGKGLGELDLKVDDMDGKTIGIAEAFNLYGMDRTVISKHLKKIFGYDVHGLPENFILVYVETDDLKKLWKKYCEYLPEVDYPCKLIGKIEPVTTGMTDILCVRTNHSRHAGETSIYHLFINMPVPKEKR
ncbi:MAG: hypothetical protein GY757_28230 [bacterium]|nr:hypothetical protein [bacterium]